MYPLPRPSRRRRLWQIDFEAAKAKAKAEKKFLLVDFTGSDWCIWCKRLKAEVFDKSEFQNEAPERFRPGRTGLPVDQEASPSELKEQNDTLRKKYESTASPRSSCWTLRDRSLPAPVIRQADRGVRQAACRVPGCLRSRRENEARHRVGKGNRAGELSDKLIDAYVKLNNENDELTGWSKEIVALDADNKAGLKIKHEFRLSMADYNKLKEKQKFANAKAALEKALALDGISAEQKQSCYMAEGELCFMQRDFAGIVEVPPAHGSKSIPESHAHPKPRP